jgi:cobalt-zinc-cadmium efflux system outer membrane protein
MGDSSEHTKRSGWLRYCIPLLTVALLYVGVAPARANGAASTPEIDRRHGARSLASPPPGEREGGERAVAIDTAIREALEGNRDLRTAYFAIDQARARLLQAGLWPNPSLALSGAHDFAFANEGEYTASVGFEQRFPVAGRIGRARDLARVDVALALAEVRDATRRLIGEVQTAFYDLLVVRAQAVVRDELIAIDRRLVAVSEARAKLAEVSALDVNTARLELQRLELEHDVLAAQAQARTAELNRILGRQPDAALALTGDIRPGPPPLLSSLRETALRRRPDLQQAALAADRARAEVQLAKAERWEDWAVGFGYDRDLQVVGGAPPQSTDQLLGLRLTVPLPLWNRNQGRIAEAGALTAQAESKIAALELTILSEIESAHRRVEDFGRVAEQYPASLAPLSDRNVQLSQDAYRQGLANVTQVVQVQRQQAELRSAYLDALAQHRRAAIDLDVAAATSPFLANPEDPR